MAAGGNIGPVDNDHLDRLWAAVNARSSSGVVLHHDDTLGDCAEPAKRTWSASTSASASAAADSVPTTLLGVKAGQTTFDVEGLDELKRQRVLPEDGTWVEPGADPTEGGRYGPEWRDEEATRQRVLEADPNYQFITLVAGAANTNVEKLYDAESVDRQLRAQIARQQFAFSLAEIQQNVESLRDSVGRMTSAQDTAEKRLAEVQSKERTDPLMIPANAHAIAVRNYMSAVRTGRTRREISTVLEVQRPTRSGAVVPRAYLDAMSGVVDTFADDVSDDMRRHSLTEDRVVQILFWDNGEMGPGLGPDAPTLRDLYTTTLILASSDDPDANTAARNALRALSRHVAMVNIDDVGSPEQKDATEQAFDTYARTFRQSPTAALSNLTDFVDTMLLPIVQDSYRNNALGLWFKEARALYTLLDTAIKLLDVESPLAAPTSLRTEPFRRTRELAAEAAREAAVSERSPDDTSLTALRQRLREAQDALGSAEQDLEAAREAPAPGGVPAGPGGLARARLEQAQRRQAAARQVVDDLSETVQRAEAAARRVLASPRNRILTVSRTLMREMQDSVEAVKALLDNSNSDSTLDDLRAAGLAASSVLDDDLAFMAWAVDNGETFSTRTERTTEGLARLDVWADAMSWYESFGGTLFLDMGVEFPASAPERSEGKWGVEEAPRWSAAANVKPMAYSPPMQLLWNRHIPDFVSALEKVTEAEASRPPTAANLNPTEQIVFDILTDIDPANRNPVWERGPLLVFATRLYRVDFAIARDTLERDIAQRRSLIEATRERMDKMLRGEPVQRGRATMPYEHRRTWVERPEHSGTVHIIPIVVKAIGSAWTLLMRQAPMVTRTLTLEQAQREPRVREDLADLVSVEMAILAQRFPKQYFNPTQRAATAMDRLNIVERFRRNLELEPTGTAPVQPVQTRAAPDSAWVAHVRPSNAYQDKERAARTGFLFM